MPLSLFPEPLAPNLPDFNTFLIAGPYPPSAPIHLCLSHRSQELKASTILFSPSRAALVNSLQNFDDASLTTNYGHGKVSELASKVSIFYPSTPGHLCLLLSFLRMSCPDDSTQGHAWINSKTTLASPLGLIVLAEPSAYFLPETLNNPVKHLRAPTLPAYLNLITRVFVSISRLGREINGCSPKFVLFDSQLDKLKLPVIHEPPPLSAFVGEQPGQQISPEAVLPLIQKYFEWVGIFEDDTLYVPSSQGSETINDDGLHKELRYYRVERGDNIQCLRWREVSIYSSRGAEMSCIILHKAIDRKTAIMSISVKSPADFHVHLRQGSMSELVIPHVRKGGFELAYVMPNLKPPITSTEQALIYKAELQRIDPDVQYLMTLYLSSELTPDEIRKAKKAGIIGVKSYPRGVTTNSDGGIESYETYYPVFEAMQEVDMVLNLHGEVPSDAAANIHVLNAEPSFLPHLFKLHDAFPKLRIVLEHATTRAAVEAVKSCGPTVACTITAHHLDLIVDDWAGQSWNFCKPVAKYPDDRQALRDVVKEGHPRFFLGSDSAPHPPQAKSVSAPTCGCAAGVYTSPILLPLVAHLLESFEALDKLEGFVSHFGRNFYKQPVRNEGKSITLLRSPTKLVDEKYTRGDDALVPFWAGKPIGWEVAA